MTDETRQSPTETVSHAGTPWRCFHCDDVFTSRSEASAHFGYEIDATPACKIAPDLRGLVKFMRWQESQLQRFRQEDSEAARQFYALGADHARALRTEEEKGYARGLADAGGAMNDVSDMLRIVLGNQLAVMCALHRLMQGFLSPDPLAKARLDARILATRALTDAFIGPSFEQLNTLQRPEAT